jgi:hypothetical protein
MTQLRKWLRANFADVFIAWIHLKVVSSAVCMISLITHVRTHYLQTIRAFVEAVLRFGPPASYEMMLLAVRRACVHVCDRIDDWRACDDSHTRQRSRSCAQPSHNCEPCDARAIACHVCLVCA